MKTAQPQKLIAAFSMLAFIVTTMTAAAASAQSKPNVVIMLGDNVGYGDIGAYGAGEVRGMPTPRIDRLATQSLRFTQYLVEPGCTPSRAALMTGRYSQRVGLSTVIIAGTPNTLQPGEVTVGKLFKSQGYATAIVGKWHLGSSETSWPTRQGFNEYHVASSRPPTAPCIAKACSAPACPRPPSRRPNPTSGSPKRMAS
jgi:arylsulfatase A-like enzyme